MTKKIEDVIEEIVESTTLEAPVEADTPKAAPVSTVAKTHVAVDGDSYASIAAKYKPAGSSTNEHAKRLFALNGGKSVVAGTIITL